MKTYKRILCLTIIALIFSFCFPFTALAANETEEAIKLSAWSRTENLAFQMKNMVPGDTETKDYRITVSDKQAVSLSFYMDMDAENNRLADVLRIKVELVDAIVYDGTFAEMPPLKNDITGKFPQEFHYRITVSLDTSVGNEYMGKSFSANFNWAIARDPNPPVTPPETTTETTTVETTPAETTTVETTATETTPVETTTAETTTVETTTAATTTATTTTSTTRPIATKPIATTVETTTVETTTVETTTEETTTETTTAETTTEETTTTETVPPITIETTTEINCELTKVYILINTSFHFSFCCDDRCLIKSFCTSIC